MTNKKSQRDWGKVIATIFMLLLISSVIFSLYVIILVVQESKEPQFTIYKEECVNETIYPSNFLEECEEIMCPCAKEAIEKDKESYSTERLIGINALRFYEKEEYEKSNICSLHQFVDCLFPDPNISSVR